MCFKANRNISSGKNPPLNRNGKSGVMKRQKRRNVKTGTLKPLEIIQGFPVGQESRGKVRNVQGMPGIPTLVLMIQAASRSL